MMGGLHLLVTPPGGKLWRLKYRFDNKGKRISLGAYPYVSLPQIGDVVIAEVDGEWTMKYFKKENGEVYLEAANPKYPIIRPGTDLQLGGVVTGVIRKYH